MNRKILIVLFVSALFSGCSLESVLMQNYGGISPDFRIDGGVDVSESNEAFDTSVNYTDSVENRFSEIRVFADHLSIWENGLIENYTGLNSHFQGIQRLKSGQYIVLSGGDINTPSSHLFIARMGSRSEQGRYRSNLLQHGIPDSQDQIVSVISIDDQMWHAGGISVMGDVLAVPLEDNNSGKIIFYDLTNPENPVLIDHYIDRPTSKSGAVALTELTNGQFLLAAWSDSDDQEKRIDFYLSNSTDFSQGFDSSSYTTWYHTQVQAVESLEANFSDFQTINFINQFDGRLYLAGLHNTSAAAPVFNGADWVDLYTVDFPDGDYQAVPVIKKVANRHFYCEDNHGNFDAAAGVYTDSTGSLGVYSAYFWKEDNQVKISEFRWVEDTVSYIDNGWVELYKDSDFGNSNIIIDYADRSLRNYSDYNTISFGDKASSVKWLLPGDYQCLLFEHDSYKGEMLQLQGTGIPEEVEDLDTFNFGDKTSSSRYCKVNIDDLSDSWIDLFEHDSFEGRKLSITAGCDGSIDNFNSITVEGESGFNDEVSSVRYQLPEGVVYRLYQHSGFKGEFLILSGTGQIEEISNLKDFGFGDKTSSSGFAGL